MVAIGTLIDDLLGNRQMDAAATGFSALTQRPDLAQQAQRLVGGSVVE